MVMVIKSNVPSNIIANPDGWNPPFTTDGLLYAGIYGRGNLSKNYAPGGVDAVVTGSPVVSNHFATFDLNNFIETGVPTTKETTLITISKRINPAKRQYFIASYRGTNDAGRSLVTDTGNPNLAMYSHYKDPTTDVSSVQFAATKQDITDGTPAFMYGRDTGKKLTIKNMTSQTGANVIVPGSAESFTNPALTYRIGRSNSGEVPEASAIAVAMIFGRALSDAEIQAAYDYFQAYFARRSIVL
ncbi:hypothetical protein EDF73_1014 [Raoultella sp. BIGb0138]|uniref:hypothetical protein n=1 Tax=Raoultella sp. BIGb0138 TaxID=2485115 RepID=UPI0010540160|nr:hypothetical protein [Raoultella sp. BIGb0138]TCW17365.1 hypothetical protein EDF73_1014 [Raoultella sp. BIGb0138]